MSFWPSARATSKTEKIPDVKNGRWFPITCKNDPNEAVYLQPRLALWLAVYSVRQTREQLQVELSACQARIADLERSLAEKGQVMEKGGGEKRPLAPLSLALLLACLAAVLVCWRYAEQMCHRVMWCRVLSRPVLTHTNLTTPVPRPRDRSVHC